jgi:beta-N-acetylhexosaminidase
VSDVTSLERKAARLCWVTLHGGAADVAHAANQRAYGVATPAAVLRRFRPGGVVLFAWADNTQHPEQVARLTADLHALAGELGHDLGVAIDEEGGRVSRLTPPATAFPSALAVAAADDDRLASARWEHAGRELAALGITVDLAPVADLAHGSNPVLGDRAFGSDPAEVAHHGALAVRGLAAHGVAAVAKHFPGHGATAVDSHLELPVVGVGEDLGPHVEVFRRLLASAPPAGVMPGHLLVRPLDPTEPATLSARILGDLLRDELGFEGAVVSDSLAMAGIRHGRDDGEVAVAALRAGVDVLLTPPDLSGAVAAIVDAVHRGVLSEARLDEAFTRSASLRARPSVLPGSVGARGVGAADHAEVASDIARRALTLRGRADLLPVEREAVVAGVAGSGARELAAALQARGRVTSLVEFAAYDVGTARLAAAGQGNEVDLGATTSTIDPTALAAALRGHRLVLVRREPELDALAQRRLLAPLAAGRDDVVVVATGGHAGDATVGGCHLHARGADPTAIAAVAELLTAPRRRLR